MKQLRDYQKQAVQECWQALKSNDEPVLLMASVGAGKSLMLADILLTIQKAGKRALCLVNNAELVRNNSETFNEQGGQSSIYCASLKCKDASAQIVFGTPQTVLNGINKKESIAGYVFNIILVDEAHAINYLNPQSCFMRILRYYKQDYKPMRVLGATGTHFRYKGTAIVGEKCLFKTQVGNITTEQLIENKYLIEPSFQIDPNLVLDFSKVKIKQNGLFDAKQLEQVIEKSTRLTELICKQIVHIMQTQKRFGIFIFATTKKHAMEIMSYLPQDESALILGETKQDDRTSILEQARIGHIKYVVNIAIISVGVDVPAFDTLAYLRPTESLVLLVQTMGRCLRLSGVTGKRDALILDFAGNIERHRDWDNPILLKALAQTVDKDKPMVIVCPACMQLNTEHARRCIGRANDKRCEYYFEFKECHNELCKAQNDIASRHCRLCQTELIDPNAKLNMKWVSGDLKEFEVLNAKYGISDSKNGFRVNIVYRCKDNVGRTASFYENYTPINDKAKHVFYGQFIKKHCENASQWYKHLGTRSKMELMLEDVITPVRLMIHFDDESYKIKRKIFAVCNESIIA